MEDRTFRPATDDHNDHFGGEVIKIGVTRLKDGSDIFIWGGDGFEKPVTRFVRTFPIEAPIDYDSWCGVPVGQDGFYYL